MSDDPSEVTLTPTARELVNEVVDKFRSDLIVAAQKNAVTASGEVQEVTVVDVIASLQSVQVGRRRFVISRTWQIVLAYIVLGTVTTLAGLSVNLIGQQFPGYALATTSTYIIAFGLIMTSGGLLLVLVEILTRPGTIIPLTSLLLDNPSNRISYTASFIQQWRNLELTARNTVSAKYGESVSKQPMSLLASNLHKAGYFDSDDEETFLRLLRVRNGILHEGDEMSQSQYRATTTWLRNLAKKLPQDSSRAKNRTEV